MELPKVSLAQLMHFHLQQIKAKSVQVVLEPSMLPNVVLVDAELYKTYKKLEAITKEEIVGCRVEPSVLGVFDNKFTQEGQKKVQRRIRCNICAQYFYRFEMDNHKTECTQEQTREEYL
jgi:hypothetical protein